MSEKIPELIEVKVLNWDTFQQRRKDVKTYHWFRLSNRIFEDDKIQCCSPVEFLFWVYLLSLCSQNDSSLILLSTSFHFRLARFKTKKLYYQALNNLSRYGLVTCSLRQIRLDKNREEEIRKDSPIPTVLVNKSGYFDTMQTGADSNESFLEKRDHREELKTMTLKLADSLSMKRKIGV